MLKFIQHLDREGKLSYGKFRHTEEEETYNNLIRENSKWGKMRYFSDVEFLKNELSKRHEKMLNIANKVCEREEKKKKFDDGISKIHLEPPPEIANLLFEKGNVEKVDASFPDEDFIVVNHATSDKWIERFQDEGINATIPPPDFQLGRICTAGIKPISDPGLYVSPMNNVTSKSVVLLVKPQELAISKEMELLCDTPECGLFRKDGLIQGFIPPERVLGTADYNRLKHAWEFTPNRKAIKGPFGSVTKRMYFDNASFKLKQ